MLTRASLLTYGYQGYEPYVLAGALSGTVATDFTDDEVETLIAEWLASPVAHNSPLEDGDAPRSVIIRPSDRQTGDVATWNGSKWTGAPYIQVTHEAPLVFTDPEWGGLGNGLDNNDAAWEGVIAAAHASGNKILVPPGKYKSSGIQLLDHVSVEGVWKYSDESAGGVKGSVIQHTGTGPAITFPNSGLGNYTQIAAVALRNLGIYAPSGDGLYTPNGAVGVDIDTVFIAPAGKGVHLCGFRQDWRVNTLRIDNGGNMQFGWFDDGQDGVGGDRSREDDCRYEYVYVGGSLGHGILRRPFLANSNVWLLPRVVTSAKHGMVCCGGITGDTIISPNFEANGYEGPSSYRAPTTGSIVSGFNQLTVASVTGLNGRTVTVEGAGGAGLDLVATVLSVAGSVLTLSANAGRTVSGAEVTSALYDDLYFGPDVGPQDTGGHATYGSGPYGNTILSPNAGIGGVRTDHNLRYGINLSGVYGQTVVSGVSQPRPIYDPFFNNHLPGASEQSTFNVVKARPSRGYITPAYQTGWSGSVRARRNGDVVEFTGKAVAAAGAGANCFQLPPWMSPPLQVEDVRGSSSSLGIGSAYIASSGGMIATNQYTSSTVIYFDGWSFSMKA